MKHNCKAYIGSIEKATIRDCYERVILLHFRTVVTFYLKMNTVEGPLFIIRKTIIFRHDTILKYDSKMTTILVAVLFK